MYLYCLTQGNYPGLSKKTKDILPLAKSKIARSAARPLLLGWRCALVRILVFSFHLLSSSRRWPRWIQTQDSWARGSRFKLALLRILCCGLHFFPFKMGTLKNSKSFHRVVKGEFSTNSTLLKGELYPVIPSPQGGFPFACIVIN